MMYWLTVYALIALSVFAAMGVLYLGIATTLWLVPAVRRILGVRVQRLPAAAVQIHSGAFKLSSHS